MRSIQVCTMSPVSFEPWRFESCFHTVLSTGRLPQGGRRKSQGTPKCWIKKGVLLGEVKAAALFVFVARPQMTTHTSIMMIGLLFVQPMNQCLPPLLQTKQATRSLGSHTVNSISFLLICPLIRRIFHLQTQNVGIFVAEHFSSV